MESDILIDGFRNLRMRLAGSEEQAARFREIAAPVLDRLNAAYWPGPPDHSRTALMGSWTRGTAVAGLSDFNIAYELPLRLLPNGINSAPARVDELTDLFFTRVLKLFPQAQRLRANASVIVALSKSLSINIRPFFWMKSDEMGYPDPTAFSQWRRFEPSAGHQALLRLDPIERENYVMICRVARIWRAVHSVPISGMLIDTLGLDFIYQAIHRRKPPKYQDCLMRDFFQFMADQDPGRDWWTVSGAEEPVFRTGAFEEVAAAAQTVAQYAIEQAANKQEKSARAAWRYLLGDFYPAH